MSYHEPELKAFNKIREILKASPNSLDSGEFVYEVVKSCFAGAYSDIIPDEKMLKAAFDAVQIHIIPELKKEQMNYNKYKDLLTPPSNTPPGTTGTNKAGGDLTFSSPGWATASLSAYANLVTTSTTPWTGGTTSVAPSNKPSKPEKPFSIDDMYAGPKPSWAKKDKAQSEYLKMLNEGAEGKPGESLVEQIGNTIGKELKKAGGVKALFTDNSLLKYLKGDK